MRRFVLPLLVSGLSLSLASCSSVPSQDRLISGIDKTQFAQGTTTKRAVSDPVCIDFYSNVTEFQKEVQANKGKRNFFSSLGLNVLSAVAIGQVVPTGMGSQASRIAAQAAAGTAAAQGKRVALQELNSSDRADAKIIEVAADIGCPVTVAP